MRGLKSHINNNKKFLFLFTNMDKISAHPRNKQKITISLIVVGAKKTTWECDTESINVRHFFKINQKSTIT